MGLMLLVVGIFAGLFVFIATTYSLTQAILNSGRTRWVHVGLMASTMMVMGALELGSVPAARLSALPVLCLAIWATALEERWYKVFPLMQQLFAVILLLGYVAI